MLWMMNEQDFSQTNKLQSDSKMTDSETLGPIPTGEKIWWMNVGQISGSETVTVITWKIE